MSAKDLAIAEDEVELLAEKGAVGREGAGVGVRGGDGGCGHTHLVGEDYPTTSATIILLGVCRQKFGIKNTLFRELCIGSYVSDLTYG